MGYRSDVTIVTTQQGWKKIRDGLITLDTEGARYMLDDAMVEEITGQAGNRYRIIQWKWVKWYEHDYINSPHIQAIMNVLEKFDEDKIPYAYTRIGEDYGDYDYQCGDRQVVVRDAPDIPTLYLKREIEVEY